MTPPDNHRPAILGGLLALLACAGMARSEAARAPVATAAPVHQLLTSHSGMAFLKTAESRRLTAYPSAGTFAIGFGHTLDPAPVITPVQAEVILRADIAIAEAALQRHVRVPLTQNQYDALVSFVYNVGENAFADSTLLRKLNRGEYRSAAREFGRWVYAQGKKLQGLGNRRAAERALFLSADQ